MILAERGASTDDPRSAPERIAALVPDTNGVSGPGRQLTALARGLQDAGISFLVIAFHRRGRPPSTFAHYLREAGVEHCVVEDGGPLDWRMVLRVGAVLRRWHPSIVQTHGYKATAVAYLLRRLRASWPWIGFFHGTTTEDVKDRLYHRVDRRLLGAAERVVVMSRVQAQAFHHCGDRVRIIYNAALDTPPAGDPAERDRLTALGSSLPRPVVGVVGRLSLEKGVDLFLDACALLVRRGLVFSALLAGDGPERARLESRCISLGLAPYVRFLGRVDNVDVVYRNLDLVVLPSRSEGLPNTLLEALRADVPVVATAVGAVPEVIGMSAAARVVAPGSVAALAEAIEQALTQGDAPGAATARREAVSRFSLERRLEAHMELYRELLEERAGVTPICVGSPAP
ncbi:MAG TPA: glycosyltransferase family 4 protein [Gemmatimonadales bacterium]|nr:glycosyltransferase family 4 protein [Gemmatimonadales bacterium]